MLSGSRCDAKTGPPLERAFASGDSGGFERVRRQRQQNQFVPDGRFIREPSKQASRRLRSGFGFGFGFGGFSGSTDFGLTSE